MPREYMILTEDFCDLPESYAEENGIQIITASYILGGQEYATEQNPEGLTSKEFYAKMRAGEDTKTVALEPALLRRRMEMILDDGMDVLYIAFSSALSSTYNNGELVARELNEERPEAKVRMVDSVSASLGQGLLVNYAVTLKKEGRTLDETAEVLERDKRKFCHYFTVDDLNFLHRGGRVSKTTAVVGSLLGIKPILHVSDEGKLIAIGRVRGRKQSLQALVDKMAGKIGDNKNDVVYISHGDCEGDANYVRDLIKKQFGIGSFIIHDIGFGIGSHSGPGTVALFFVGDSRTE